MRILSGRGARCAGIFVAALVAACDSDSPPFQPSPSPSTIRLTGTVYTAGDTSIPVIGAGVQVVGAGLATVTDSYGWYSLQPVPVDAEIRVTKEGYEPSVASRNLRTDLSPFEGALAVPLTWTGPIRGDVSGDYTLTLSARCPPASTLPAPLRARRYRATIVRGAGAQVEVQLGGADFEIEQGSGNGDRFAGRIVDEGILFGLQDAYDWGPHPNVLERLPDGARFEVSGQMLARHSETGFSGTLHGSFRRYPVDAWGGGHGTSTNRVFRTPTRSCSRDDRWRPERRDSRRIEDPLCAIRPCRDSADCPAPQRPGEGPPSARGDQSGARAIARRRAGGRPGEGGRCWKPAGQLRAVGHCLDRLLA